jgi:disease resistance protein RPM1
MCRCKVDTIKPDVTTLDPRITALYAKETDLVGINKAREELIMKLTRGDDVSMQQQMIVSIVGFGGLGKTTLAKAVHDKIKSQFKCTAFVTVSQNPDRKKILKDMLYELNKEVHGNIHSRSLDENQLIDTAREFLCDKRYASYMKLSYAISNNITWL